MSRHAALLLLLLAASDSFLTCYGQGYGDPEGEDGIGGSREQPGDSTTGKNDGKKDVVKDGPTGDHPSPDTDPRDPVTTTTPYSSSSSAATSPSVATTPSTPATVVQSESTPEPPASTEAPDEDHAQDNDSSDPGMNPEKLSVCLIIGLVIATLVTNAGALMYRVRTEAFEWDFD